MRINGFNRFYKSAAETFVEAVIDLAGVNQIVSVATADVDAVPFFFVEREARDGKHLPLRTGLLDPAIPSATRVRTVAHLRHHALTCAYTGGPSISKLSLNWTSVSATIFFSAALRSCNGSLHRSRPLRYSRSKATSTIVSELPFNSFCRTEKSVVPSSAGATTSPSMTALPVPMCQASAAIFLNRWVQS